ncbi:hypothetical protein Bpfe_006796 [Biomphalaria pfeifferi]|uniref:Uncharacterized protein n=1 Tax=Biomphalaria pfeifferi TaxID=112525 RepID=A0AAD8C1B6_BIOPF|nr:hypothetical protein Bpfe_006796 [Biomphalaria pfeifferi]
MPQMLSEEMGKMGIICPEKRYVEDLSSYGQGLMLALEQTETRKVRMRSIMGTKGLDQGSELLNKRS